MPTVEVHRPTPYDPGYHTVGQLVHDSLFIFWGVLEAPVPCGSNTTCYPVQAQNILGGTDPRISLAVSGEEAAAAHLNVGDDYVMFFGAETSPLNTLCLVGGVRGIMTYDPATRTVSRLDHTPHSQIPRVQKLGQLKSQIQQVENAIARAPVEVPPAPVCSPSATGLAAS